MALRNLIVLFSFFFDVFTFTIFLFIHSYVNTLFGPSLPCGDIFNNHFQCAWSKHTNLKERICQSRLRKKEKESHAMVMFFPHYDQNPWEDKLREERFILAHSFRGVSPSEWGQWGGTEQLPSWWIRNREKGSKGRDQGKIVTPRTCP
jgi:hypothetical protein